MANRLGRVLYCLERANAEAAEPASDRQLLERFLQRPDQSAFESLLERHGPMVYGVCRRLLDDPADVDDAFQATFLVLIRRAAAISWRESLGGWLHQVARRVALRARALRLRHPAGQSEADDMPSRDTTDPAAAEVQRLLDEELQRLPSRYRDPLILCYLEGMTHAEAARELGCPRGSMNRLLTQAQELLRERLRGRGVTLSAGLALVLAQTASAVPRSLMQATIGIAVAKAPIAGTVSALAEGVLRTMFVNQLRKLGLVVAVLALLTGGLGWFWPAGQAVEPVADAPAAAAALPAVAVKPFVAWSGADSRVRDSSYRRITSAEEWKRLWEAHRGGDVPEVDFERCLVVAVFQGATVNRRPIQFVSATDEPELLRVRFVSIAYHAEPGDAVTPYGLFLMPRSAKAIVLEENAQTPLDPAPVWKLRAQLDPTSQPPTVTKPVVDVSAKGIEQRLKDIAHHADPDNAFREKVREAATMLLSEEKDAPARFPLQFQAPAANANAEDQFRKLLQTLQMAAGLTLFKLETMLQELDDSTEARDQEVKTWQGHHDYVRARLAARISFLYEYNAQLGKLRREFPPRDPAKDQGWQLMAGGDLEEAEARKSARRATQLLKELAERHAGTPLGETAAKELEQVAPGLRWQAWPKP